MTRKKIKRKVKGFSLKFLWPIFPAGLLIFLSFYLSKSKIFFLKRITCHLDQHPCSLQFEPTLVGLTNTNIFKLKVETVKQELVNLDPTLANIEIKKSLPNSLFITMTKRASLAQVAFATNLTATLSGIIQDKYFHLDKTGEVFSETNIADNNLPLVLVSDSKDIGVGRSKTSEGLANLINTLNNHYVGFSTISLLSNNTLTVKTQGEVYATFIAFESITPKVASLQYILSNIKIGEELPTIIDLRFDKPVLTY